jgi:hypothetical protein
VLDQPMVVDVPDGAIAAGTAETFDRSGRGVGEQLFAADAGEPDCSGGVPARVIAIEPPEGRDREATATYACEFWLFGRKSWMLRTVASA